MSRILSSRRNGSTREAVSSVEPSSTMMSSKSARLCRWTDSIADPMVAFELYAGMTIENVVGFDVNATFS